MSEPLALHLRWYNGSVPPRFRKSGTVHLQPDGTLRILNREGYRDGTDETWEGSLSPEASGELARGLDALGLWRTPWAEPDGPPRVGGSTTSLNASWHGQDAVIPSIVLREQAESKREIVRAIQAAARAAVMD